MTKYNVILGYKIVLIKNIEYFLVTINSKTNHFELKNLVQLTKPRYLKLKDLNKLNNKTTYSNYILCTSKGFLNIKEAIIKKTGGLLAFRIF